MTFYVGQKVVCIEDGLDGSDIPGTLAPRKGDIGIVARVDIIDGDCLIELVEFPAPASRDYEAGWEAIYFRPLVSDTRKVFLTDEAPKDSERWDNRKQKVRA